VAVTRPLALALRALGLGDFLTALPALRALARALPEHRVAVAAPAALAPLAALVEELDALVPAAPLSKLPALGAVDVAVNLHGRGPESHRVLLTLAPRRLVAFRHDMVPESAGGPRFDPSEHEVRRWCRLMDEAGMPADPDDLALRLDDAPLGPGGHAVLHPGAAVAGRRWPPERFAAVARALVRRGRRVVVSAGPGEEALAKDVIARAGLPAHALFAGRDLRALARLVRDAGLVVCGDTGLGHLATAFGTPSVLLFGPTPPALWGPPANRPWHRVLHRGGRGDPHAAALDPALAAISVDDVVGAIDGLERLLAGRRSATPAAASA
jgi:ADP-heptose:LPS heptosyltransferase